jgi:two-component system sensor histidine kinase KdpD
MGRRPAVRLLAGLLGVAAATAALRLAQVTNPTTIALGYLLVTLFVASLGDLTVALTTAIAATLCFNFFFMPPVGAFTIADPHNWVALVSFLIVSIVASRLSASARAKTQEALDRRNELTRLFDLTRDILLTTERDGAMGAIARHVARRFEIDMVAICVPRPGGGWAIHHGGAASPEIAEPDLERAFARQGPLFIGPVTLAPVRIGAKAIGLLATGGRPLEAGTRDAVAGIVAIALERSEFLEERRGAELTRQRAELSSALLASLSHDLRTPLTVIRTAVSNLDSVALPEELRREQARLASGQLERLTRLFDEILDMARIDAGSVHPRRTWTTPAEIVEAAVTHASAALGGRDVRIDAADDVGVEIDPRLAASALAHLLENAAQYAPDGPIAVRARIEGPELRLEVRDQGPGLPVRELERLFEPFYRGELVRQHVPGTGMGLAITRGLVNADGGRVWAENVAPHGAAFTIAVPARSRVLAAAD